ncbi:MAG TPA: aldehyde dehydrogenase family protein [Pyrinomonadaceae bacterium]|jgi:succinate-semialdehyde dehydrogenase/glutarate-semialdehyde dehydrogenase
MSAVLSFPTKQEEIVSYNPATNEEIGRVPVTSAENVKSAVEKSRAAFLKWRATSFKERARVVMKAREVILAEMEEIARLISDESGKPFAEALSMEISPVLDLMQYFSRNAAKILKPEKINIGLYATLGRYSKIIYQPLGVVGIIPAWNYPFSIPLGETAMSLLAGNTVILKPSELTPFIGLKIGGIFEKAGAPESVVQILTGDGRTGAAMVDAGVNKIMFTGSVATGKRIAENAAKHLTSVVLELGGKDPMIVFKDANLNIAAEAAIWGAFCNSGQSCSSVERLYVEESVAEEFTNLIVEKTRKLRQNYGSDESTDIAAMSSERQLKLVEEHVASFAAEGAKILTGGKRNADFEGSFFEPTVIGNADNSMRAMREETFGPTLPIAVFKTEEEAVQLANDSEFGLTASVWTRDLTKGKRVAEKIEAGTVCVNEVLYTHGIGQTPWGGFKNSGYGRTHGRQGLLELVQPQHIHVNRFAILPNAWWLPYSPEAVETFRGFARYFATGSLFQTMKLAPQLLRRIKELRKK